MLSRQTIHFMRFGSETYAQRLIELVEIKLHKKSNHRLNITVPFMESKVIATHNKTHLGLKRPPEYAEVSSVKAVPDTIQLIIRRNYRKLKYTSLPQHY